MYNINKIHKHVCACRHGGRGRGRDSDRNRDLLIDPTSTSNRDSFPPACIVNMGTSTEKKKTTIITIITIITITTTTTSTETSTAHHRNHSISRPAMGKNAYITPLHALNHPQQHQVPKISNLSVLFKAATTPKRKKPGPARSPTYWDNCFKRPLIYSLGGG